MTFHDLLKAAGSPLEAALDWDEETITHIRDTTRQGIREAAQRWPNEPERAIQHLLIGLFAQGFLIGREHALSGLALPGAARRTLAGLTLDDVPNLIIPDDIRGL